MEPVLEGRDEEIDWGKKKELLERYNLSIESIEKVLSAFHHWRLSFSPGITHEHFLMSYRRQNDFHPRLEQCGQPRLQRLRPRSGRERSRKGAFEGPSSPDARSSATLDFSQDGFSIAFQWRSHCRSAFVILKILELEWEKTPEITVFKYADMGSLFCLPLT
jgi:hypothetical protein